MLTSQISYFDIVAFIHFFSCSTKLSRLKSKQSGQPMVLQKSLPVPIGNTPKVHCVRSTQDLMRSLMTQLNVPSPPQTIILIIILATYAAFFKLSIADILLCWSKRSTKFSSNLLGCEKQELKLVLRQDMTVCPQRFPLLVLMKKQKVSFEISQSWLVSSIQRFIIFLRKRGGRNNVAGLRGNQTFEGLRIELVLPVQAQMGCQTQLFLRKIMSYSIYIDPHTQFPFCFDFPKQSTKLCQSSTLRWIYNHMKSNIFKYVGILALISTCLATLQVYSPQCAVSRFTKPIEYTLSNFGDIPYGEILLGRIRVPKEEHLCTMEGQTYVNNKESGSRVIFLVKRRGGCKFTQKVINAQNLGADLIIIYDDEPGDKPTVIMKNDGHGHLAEIPSLFISNTDGENLRKTNNDCKDLPVVKVKFDIQQAEVSKVILWLDANNRESFILARDFYKNDYYKILQNKIEVSIRFRADTHCKDEIFCKKTDCVGIIKEKYCRSVESSNLLDPEKGLNGQAVILEQLREHFLWEQLSHSEKMNWWKYMTQFDKEDCVEVEDITDCSYTVMRNVGIDDGKINKIEALVKETIQNVTDEKPNILKENSFQANELGIYFYPEATINNRNFYGLFKAAQVFEMICDSLINPPKECITFIKNNNQIDTNDGSSGLWKTVLLTLLFMTLGFLAALFIYTKIIRREVDQQLSVEVNKMVENYVNLAEKKKGSATGNSYSKFDS